MAPKRKAAASQPRTGKRIASAAAKVDAAAESAAGSKKGRGKAASKSAAAPSAAPAKKLAAPKRGGKTKAKATASDAAASAAAAGPSKAASAAAPPASTSKRPVDDFCAESGVEVVGVYDVIMNQTNIGANNNKFYRLQMLQQTGGGRLMVWTRWGRVGMAGQSKMLGPFTDLSDAEQEFKSKFRTKAGAAWDDRASIQPKAGKYVPVDIDHDAQPPPQSSKSPAKRTVKYKPSVLDSATQDLVSLVFDHDMFTSTMKTFEIDVERFPLGQLSSAQVTKGHDVLQELKDAVNNDASADELQQLTSKFYTTIPHAVGFRRPPVLSTMPAINAKVEMMNVLSDIEVAQGMLAEREDSEQEQIEQDHPADEKYKLLDADLELLTDADAQMDVIRQYVAATVGQAQADLANVWRVTRKGEAERFAQHGKLGNRRLLWHGTNVAVVAAVLKTGLRIMPHSGGRVGKGIYLASEHSKSAAYTRCGKLKNKSVGVLFLAEAALGKEHSIERDDSSLAAAPKGYDSVVARGRREPDPSRDTTIKLDGKSVTVPQGSPVAQPKYVNSSFDQSEYLLYKETQVSLRYVVTFNFARGY